MTNKADERLTQIIEDIESNGEMDSAKHEAVRILESLTSENRKDWLQLGVAGEGVNPSIDGMINYNEGEK